MNLNPVIKKYQKVQVKELENKCPDNPTVSVCVVTYQHVNYIKKCLDGILIQKTTFNFEILLGEDESTDGTREICIDYAKQFPEKIKLALHSRQNNILVNNKPSGKFNSIYNYSRAKGKYIALCEGDDYWTDSCKLQKQVDFLEGNPDFSMVFHNALIINDIDLTKKLFLPLLDKSVFDTEDTLYPFRSFAPTASIVFRNALLKYPFPKWFYSCILGDRMLFTMLSKHGKIKYFDFIGSVRRIHAGSITLTFTAVSDAINRIIFFKNIPSYLGSEYKQLCNRYLKYFYELLIKIYFENNSNNYSKSVSILKGIQYLFSPNYIFLYKVNRINNNKSPYYVFLFSKVIRFYTFIYTLILYKFLRPPIRALLIRIFPQMPGEKIIDEIVNIFLNRKTKN